MKVSGGEGELWKGNLGVPEDESRRAVPGREGKKNLVLLGVRALSFYYSIKNTAFKQARKMAMNKELKAKMNSCLQI